MMEIKNILKRKKEVRIPLNPEEIRRDQIINSLTRENQGLKAQLSEQSANEKEESELRVQEDKEKKLKNELQKQEQENIKKKFEGSLSLKKFFNKYFNDKKFRNELELTTYDFSESLGKFGDINLLPSGHIAVLDQYGNIICMGRELSHVFYTPGGILKNIEMGKIPLCKTKGGEPKINQDLVNIPKVVYDEEKKVYRHSEEAGNRAITQIISKDKELREIKTNLDMLENVNIDLRKENEDLRRANKFIEAEKDNAKSVLSQVMESSMQSNLNTYELQKKIVEHTEYKAMLESLTNTYQNLMKNILNELEESGDKTTYRKAMEMYKETSASVITQMDKLSGIIPKPEINITGGAVETQGVEAKS